MNAARVLVVGNCSFDNAMLRRWLAEEFQAEHQAVQTGDEAVHAVGQEKYDLVIVNRVLDYDGSSGVEVIERLRQEKNVPPTMLLSNYSDAQAAATAAGAVPGFGKNDLPGEEARSRVAPYLMRE